MKNTSLLVLAFLIYSVSGFAQFKVHDIDMDTLKALVDNNPDYILDINERKIDLEGVVGEEENFILYYGSVFLENYSPYGERMLLSVFDKFYEEKDYEGLIKGAEGMLRQNPGHISAFLDLANAYSYLQDTAKATFYYDRYASLLSVPFYSGKGNSIENAHVVRSIDDEYLIVREQGYSVVSQALVKDKKGISYDVLTVTHKDDPEKTTEIYFNIHFPFASLGNSFNLSEKSDKPNKSGKSKKSKKSKKGKKGKKA